MNLSSSRISGRFASRFGLLAIALILLLSRSALALMLQHKGGEPVQAEPNWPAGTVDVANLKTRLGYWEFFGPGGGQRHFLYRGDAKAFQEALDLFAKIDAPAREIHVHPARPGPQNTGFLKDEKDPKAEVRVDWTFTAPAPRLDVYAGKDGKDGIDWKMVKVPTGVKVIDQRASANGYADGSVLIADITDLVTSKPLAGVRVALGTASFGTTDDKGHVELRKVPEGSYRIDASKDGMATRVIGYVNFGSDTYNKVSTGLAPVAQLSGTVTDKDGKPLADVNVRADNIQGPDKVWYDTPDRPQVTSDAQGKFTLTPLPRGHIRIFAYSKTHLLMNGLKDFDVPADNIALSLTGTGIVKIRVAQADGTPQPGYFTTEIESAAGKAAGTWGGSANMGDKGVYSFENVPAGKYIVRVYPTPRNTNDPGNPKDVEVKPGETAELVFSPKQK